MKKAAKAPPDPKDPIHIAKRIVIGTIAEPLARPEGGATHRWTAYVRGVNAEDISKFVRRITFRLDPSFPKPQRVVESHPFQVQEQGWGEFELVITVQLRDGGNPTCITFMHPLKLFHDCESLKSSKRPVVSERYEEIIFTMGSEQQQKRFMHASRIHEPSLYQELYTKFDDKNDIQRLKDAQHVVEKELLRLAANFELLQDERDRLVEEIGANGGTKEDLSTIYAENF